MKWLFLTETKQLDNLLNTSVNQAVIVFKHSTRCNISAMVKDRLERHSIADIDMAEAYLLDLIQYRDLSNQIANTFNIEHESPQVLVIRDRKCIYAASHNSIIWSDIKETIKPV